jgi:predicted nucleic acid-binding protein
VSVFIDTNILVYRFDNDVPTKQKIARERYVSHVREGTALLSVQVLQEFYSCATRKLSRPMKTQDARAVVNELCVLPLVIMTPAILLAAIDKSTQLSLSFWDALIVQSAIAGGATTLLTEDMQHGQAIEGVTIENPFL